VELGYEHGFLTEPDYRRLLQRIGEKEKRKRQAKLPVWDREERELRFEGTVVRTIRSLAVAHNIVAILDAFEAYRWRFRVDAPAELVDQALYDAVHTLNKGLKKMKFHVDGDGRQIRWARRR
jgi:hypothetical protein